MSFLTKIEKLDTRIVHASMLLLIVFALLNPFGLPLRISGMTRALYDYIEKLPAGSNVAYIGDIAPGLGDEYGPCAGAVLTQLTRRPLKVVIMMFAADSPLMFERMLRIGWGEIASDKKYGVDYVVLGYSAGVETAMASAASDLHQAFPSDFYGKSISDLPMMKDIKSAKDFRLLVHCTSSTLESEAMVRQWQSTYGIPMAWIVTAVQVPPQMPYYPRQVFAILGGTRAAAEYELLIKRPSAGLQNTDALSISQTLVLLYVVIGNVAYFASRQKKKPQGGGTN